MKDFWWFETETIHGSIVMCWHNKKWIYTNLIIIFLFIVGFIGIEAYVYNYNENVYVCNLESKTKDYSITIESSKNWNESAHGYNYGIQYDAFIYNNMNTDIRDWVAYINVPDDCILDSYWNGEFVLEDGIITIKPVVYNKVIEANGKRDIGFVLHSNLLDNIENFEIHFYRLISREKIIFFWVLVFLGVLYIFINIVIIIFNLKTKKIKEQKEEYVNIVNESFLTFANMIDAKDPYTKGHSQRVAIYAKEIARRMGLDEEEQQHLFYVALLHDIGKIGTADAILKKNGKLTTDEREEIEQHVKIGGDILKDFSAIEGIEAGARYHHERYDGQGYTTHIKGKEIPLFARIICVADSFDAMTSVRCYRPKLSIETVIEELKKCSGTQFDPDIVPYMIEMIEDGVAPIEIDKDYLYSQLVIKRKKSRHKSYENVSINTQ